MHGFMLAILANYCPNVNTLKHINTNVKMVTLRGANVPKRLRDVPDSPKTLYSRGTDLAELVKNPVVAIVGSRKVDSYGTHTTHMLSYELSAKGFVVVSGLALGVDAIAHRACLEAGSRTIAVLPCGIDTVYPRTNSLLATKIIDNGCLVSENTGDYLPHEYDFLIRNRIISGLADIVIITQAAARSGSLNTARHALEQGKIVMAVPGPITSPLCEGTNNLLKMGASPVTCTQDVLHALGYTESKEIQTNYDLLAGNEQELALIQLLKDGICDGEEMLIRSQLSAQEFNVHLTMLEIRGVILPLGANNWTLA